MCAVCGAAVCSSPHCCLKHSIWLTLAAALVPGTLLLLGSFSVEAFSQLFAARILVQR